MAVECKKCENWSHIKRQNTSKKQYEKMQDCEWKCFECENSPTDNQTRKPKLFERHVDDTICTVKDNPQ